MKAQQIILKELSTEFGGAARAVGSDFFGTVTRAFNAIDDFRKEFIKGFGTGAFDGARKLFEYIIDNQVVIGENFRRIAYDFTHNFIFDAIKSMGQLLKFSFDGWVQIGGLWEDFFGDSFFTTVTKGWKMLFIVIESGWSMIIETVTNGIINPIEKTFNKIKAIGTFLTGGDYSAALAAADAKNATISDRGFSANINRLFEEMNEKVFAVQTGQDVRQRNAQFALDKSLFNLGGQTAASGLLGAATGTDTTGGKIKNAFIGGQIESATGTPEDEFFANRMKQQAEHNALVLEQREEERKLAMEQQQAYYDGTTNIINESENAMLSTIEFFADQSIATFTSMSTNVISSMSSILKSIGSMGGGGGLFGTGSSILGGLSILGAGIGLVGGVAGALMADDEESSGGGLDASDGLATTSRAATQPTASITKTGPETVNYYISNDIKTGMIIGEYGVDELATILTQKQKNQQLSMI
jgi:hypothetical protein